MSAMSTPVNSIPLKTSQNINQDDDSNDPLVQDVLNEFKREIKTNQPPPQQPHEISYQPPSSSSTSNISLIYTNSTKKCAGIGRVNEGIFAHIDINIIQHYYHVMNISLFSLQSSLINYNYIISYHECKGFVVLLDHGNK